MRRSLIVAFTTFVLATPALAQPKREEGAVYEWTDERGQAHYTDDYESIPAKSRARARKLDTPELTRLPSETRASGGGSGSTGDASADSGGGDGSERQWRQEFQAARARIAELEKQLAEDRALLENPAYAPRYTSTGFRSPEAAAATERIERNQQELTRAREALEELERRARNEAVPLEWRD